MLCACSTAPQIYIQNLTVVGGGDGGSGGGSGGGVARIQHLPNLAYDMPRLTIASGLIQPGSALQIVTKVVMFVPRYGNE